MPEIVEAYERGTEYFGAVRVQLANEPSTFEFGVGFEGYKALRHILQSRPLGEMPGVAHRFFFTGSYSRRIWGLDPVTFRVRVEIGKNAKTFDFDGPTSLVNNLVWFAELRTLESAKHLKQLPHH